MRTLKDVVGSVGTAASAVGHGVGEFAKDMRGRFSNWRKPAADTRDHTEADQPDPGPSTE